MSIERAIAEIYSECESHWFNSEEDRQMIRKLWGKLKFPNRCAHGAPVAQANNGVGRAQAAP